MVAVTFILTAKAFPSYSGKALEGAIVRVYSEDGGTFITYGVTDSAGRVTLDLPDSTTYWVRFFQESYAFDSQLTVDADSGASSNTFSVEGEYLLEYPPSANAYLCRASGYVRGADWAPRAGVRFTFMMTGRPRVVAGQVMVVSDVWVQSDPTGWVEVELVRGGSYDVLVTDMDDELPLRVQVPDAGSVSLTELIWPYVASLEYDVTSLTMSVGDEQTVTPTVTLSSGVTTPYEMDNDDWFYGRSLLEFSSTDAEVAELRWAPDSDSFTVIAKAEGSTTLTAAVREDREAVRFPEPTRNLASLTITVTA